MTPAKREAAARVWSLKAHGRSIEDIRHRVKHALLLEDIDRAVWMWRAERSSHASLD